MHSRPTSHRQNVKIIEFMDSGKSMLLYIWGGPARWVAE